MSKLKVGKIEVERLRLREDFASQYKTLNSMAGSNTARCYAVFKYSFYNVRNGRDLLVKKGLISNTDDEPKTRKYNKYLDYAGVKELTALLDGLLCLRNIISDKSENFQGYPLVYEQILKMGRERRYIFLNENGKFPENMQVEKKSIAYLKKCITPIECRKVPKKLTKERTHKSLTSEELLGEMRKELDDMEQKRKSNQDLFDSTSLKDFEIKMKRLYLNMIEQIIKNPKEKKDDLTVQTTLVDDDERKL